MYPFNGLANWYCVSVALLCVRTNRLPDATLVVLILEEHVEGHLYVHIFYTKS